MSLSPYYTCASLEKLQEIKDVTEDDAKLIRRVWKATKDTDFETLYPQVKAYLDSCHTRPYTIQIKRWIVDSILNTCGVEFLGMDRRSGDGVNYCNAGDTYATTILFIGKRLVVGCWGDLVEANRIREIQ